MATHSFTIKESLLFGWETFKKNWQFLVGAFLVIVVIGMIPGWLQDWAQENASSLTFLFTVLGWIVQMITSIGVIVISLKLVDGKKPEFADIYQHYPLLLNYFLGSVLYGLVIIAGLILLIVPGIIWGIKYQYTTYLIVDKKMSPMEAFKKSGKITQGVKMKLFYLGLIFVAITIAGMLLFGVGLIVAWPVVSLAGAYVYRKLIAKAS